MIHPIPSGTRDVLPDEMRELRAITEALRGVFEARGYGEVCDAGARVRGDAARARTLGDARPAYRVFDDHGDVLALRSDMTRADRPRRRHALRRPPSRRCASATSRHAYRGVRPHRGQPREFLQAGIELVGAPAPDGTAEALTRPVPALDAAGLRDYRVGLGDASLYPALLDAFGRRGRGARRGSCTSWRRATSSAWSARLGAARPRTRDAASCCCACRRCAAAPEVLETPRARSPTRWPGCARVLRRCSRPTVAERVIFDLGLSREPRLLHGRGLRGLRPGARRAAGRRRALRRPARALRAPAAGRRLRAQRRPPAHRAGRRGERRGRDRATALTHRRAARRAVRRARSTCLDAPRGRHRRGARQRPQAAVRGRRHRHDAPVRRADLRRGRRGRPRDHRQGRAHGAVRARRLRAARPRLRALPDGPGHRRRATDPAAEALRRLGVMRDRDEVPADRGDATSSDTGRQAEIVEVKGSVELAPLTGLVEAIVDLTATGTTLRENGLVVREEIVGVHRAADRQPGRPQAEGARRSTTCWSGSRARLSGCALGAPSLRPPRCARSRRRRTSVRDAVRGDRRARCASEGDAALSSTTPARFDTAAPSRWPLRVPRARARRGAGRAAPRPCAPALELAIANVARWRARRWATTPTSTCRRASGSSCASCRSARAAIYVPGGRDALPVSTVVMGAVTARGGGGRGGRRVLAPARGDSTPSSSPPARCAASTRSTAWAARTAIAALALRDRDDRARRRHRRPRQRCTCRRPSGRSRATSGIDGFLGPERRARAGARRDGRRATSSRSTCSPRPSTGRRRIVVAVSPDAALLDARRRDRAGRRAEAARRSLVDARRRCEAALAFAEAFAPEHLQLMGARGRGASRRACAAPAACSSARRRRRRSATTSRARTTRCPPAGRRGSRRRCRRALPAPHGRGARGAASRGAGRGGRADRARRGVRRARRVDGGAHRENGAMAMTERTAEIHRSTKETDVARGLALDGDGRGHACDRRRLPRPHARPARAPRRGSTSTCTCTRRPRDRRAPHGRGHGHRARPGARRRARRPARDHALRPRRRADGRGARDRARSTSPGRPLLRRSPPSCRRARRAASTTSWPRSSSARSPARRELTLHLTRRGGHERPPHDRGGLQGVRARAARGGRRSIPRETGVPVDEGDAHVSRARSRIVDYGMGNRRSVEKALEHVGARAALTADHDELRARRRARRARASARSREAMRRLRAAGPRRARSATRRGGRAGHRALPRHAAAVRRAPSSTRARTGLGLLPGRVVPLDAARAEAAAHRLEHRALGGARRRSPPGCRTRRAFYHVHSFAPVPADRRRRARARRVRRAVRVLRRARQRLRRAVPPREVLDARAARCCATSSRDLRRGSRA